MSKLEQRMTTPTSTPKLSRTTSPTHSLNTQEQDLVHLFPRPTERFFASFAIACDSHALASHLQTLVLAELDRLPMVTESSSSPDKLAERVSLLLVMLERRRNSQETRSMLLVCLEGSLAS